MAIQRAQADAVYQLVIDLQAEVDEQRGELYQEVNALTDRMWRDGMVQGGRCHRGCSLRLLYCAMVLFLSFPFLFLFLFLSHFLIFNHMTKEKTSIRDQEEH